MPEQSSPSADPDRADDGAAPDWASDIAGRIETFVVSIRERTSDRLVDLVRLLIFGLIAAVMAVMALVIALIVVVRILDIVLPGEVWLPYLVLGCVLIALGGLCWSKRA